jgi:hypothetical protein
MNAKINRLSRIFFGIDVSDYALVLEKDHDTIEFSKKIREAVKNGWVPLGPPFVAGTQLIQALVR